MEQMMMPEDVAKVLNVSVRWLYNARYRGDGPRAVKVGKFLRYLPADVEAYQLARTDDATSAA